MAFLPQCFLGFLARINKTRYFPPYLSSSISYFQFSTLYAQHNTSNNNPSPPSSSLSRNVKQSDIDEFHILNELSNLLPISHKPIAAAHTYQPTKQNDNIEPGVVADRCLSPEEKLRGVFLQKLKGKSAIESALEKTGVDLSMDVVANVLNWGNLGGESMVTFFNWAIKSPMIPNDIHTYNVLIRALGRRKYVDFVMKILIDVKVRGIDVNLETLSVVIDSFLRARRVYKAIQLFGNSKEYGFGYDTESLNVLLQCLCKRSHVGAANSYFNSVKGKIPFNSSTYNIIIGGWSKFGRVTEMERVLEAMVEDGFDPDCNTFSCLLEGLGRADRTEDAVKMFNNLKEKDCLIDTGVYNAMISNFILCGNLDECMKFYRCMISSNCNPDIDTYTKMITAFIRARKVADALELFDEMLSRQIVPTTGIITSFIEPLCSFGPPHAAMMIHKKARKVEWRELTGSF
ncbi:putative pentatricopeptide repeat-containing protein At5g43820 isoform X2 [Mercurialis annua]|uniref:putative pentatricopeptide repeat-containing protein At5g43820 isoform X2 n=1 Tax=Mercurialis annua TaxID=3986 RepID=UPI0021606166|nr:putative pentatricopeptide repeat-containing protein At5g43820 isoform X2 [Mercurialis annua]